MAINIHFFRKSSLEKIDFDKVLDYFETLPNFKIYYTDEYVEAVCNDKDFEFEYRYLITRQSRVKGIYDLNPAYININFLLEMPVLIPSFLAKEILTLAQKICKQFDLDIYHESFADVKPFNVVDMLVLFEQMRAQYVEEYGMQGKIKLDGEKLGIVFKYQRSIQSLVDYYNGEVTVGSCFPMTSHVNSVSGIGYRWVLGEAAVFPPYIDYIYVENEGQTYLVKRADFYRILSKYFIEIKTFLPDLYVIKGKNAKNCKKEVKKLAKFAIDASTFVPLRLCDAIEE